MNAQDMLGISLLAIAAAFVLDGRRRGALLLALTALIVVTLL